MRLLFLAPGHPELQPGGTEALAHGLFSELRERHGVEGMFLGATHDGQLPAHPGTRIQPAPGGQSDELLVSLDRFDRFFLSQPDAVGLVATLAPLVKRLRPDVIHLHHPMGFGLETLELLRRLAPRAALVATLHDFFPICPREGQLLTTQGALCQRPSPDACRRCLPERSAEDLALRRLSVAGAYAAADALIAPSAFLRDRFVAAGWEPARITVLRNGVPAAPPAPHRAAPDGRRDRFAVFGQLTRFKGALVALGASALLSAEGVSHGLALHGPAATHSPAFMAEFEAALAAAAPAARHHGTYAPADLSALMAEADWVLVPSIWWENAPLVVLEAFRHRRPVICAGVGGMAELVRDGEGGLHAPRGDAASWAEAMKRAVTSKGLWQSLVNRIPTSRDLAAVAEEHLALYRDLLARRRPGPRPAVAPQHCSRATAAAAA
jgi:glycosyltransferase involved in cell wall biosynthesis